MSEWVPVYSENGITVYSSDGGLYIAGDFYKTIKGES